VRSVLIVAVVVALVAGRRLPAHRLPAVRRIRARRECRQLTAEIPSALERLAASMRAGGGVIAGLSVAAAGDGVLARDLARVLADVECGSTLPEALGRWRSSRPQPEVMVTAGALEVVVMAGGRAAAALEGLAAGLRDAADCRAEVVAQSTQARLSAVVVGVAPVAALALTALVDPGTAAVLVTTAPGRACLTAALMAMTLAALWMARLVRTP
jgi:tight adherence protein B